MDVKLDALIVHLDNGATSKPASPPDAYASPGPGAAELRIDTAPCTRNWPPFPITCTPPTVNCAPIPHPLRRRPVDNTCAGDPRHPARPAARQPPGAPAMIRRVLPAIGAAIIPALLAPPSSPAHRPGGRSILIRRRSTRCPVCGMCPYHPPMDGPDRLQRWGPPAASTPPQTCSDSWVP